MTHDKPHLDPARSRQMLDRLRVAQGEGFHLDCYPTDDAAPDIIGEADAKLLLKEGIQRLATHQELLYANATWSLLIVFQAMDAAGKDSSIKHVMSGINPQGVAVTSFKQPGPEARRVRTPPGTAGYADREALPQRQSGRAEAPLS